jgi:8-oxo-dGTP pyrophosphatase MutT (NUDIX family)
MLTRHLLNLVAGTRWGRDDRRAGPGGTPLQVAALPYRVDAENGVEILLVTSRTSRRWIIPKGWPVKGLSLAKSAAREAYEEAGVRGDVGQESIGHLQSARSRGAATHPRTVMIFPLRVSVTLDRWPESAQRRRLWLPQCEAVAKVDGGALKHILADFTP